MGSLSNQKPATVEEAVNLLDENAHEVLKLIHSQVRNCVCDETERDDVVQDMFISIRERVQNGSYNFEFAITTFIHNVVKFETRNHLARVRRRKGDIALSDLTNIPRTNESAVRHLIGKEVIKRLEAEPDEIRTAVRMGILGDATLKQIAREIGCTPEWVRRLLNRWKAKEKYFLMNS